MKYMTIPVKVHIGADFVPVNVTLSERVGGDGTVFVVKIMYWEYDHPTADVTEDAVIHALKDDYYRHVKTQFI